jgi:ubiquitin C-terminal hydrolase
MSSLTHSLKSTIHPGEFIKCVKFHGGETINPLVQQDVNEFFMAFVDLLEKNSAQPLLNATLCG